MPKFILSLLTVSLLAVAAGCSTDPEDSPPKFRVSNERTTNASLQVKTSGGNTININNVTPGQITEFSEVAEGVVDVTVTIQGETNAIMGSFMAEKNRSFTVVVANTTPPTLRIDVQ